MNMTARARMAGGMMALALSAGMVVTGCSSTDVDVTPATSESAMEEEAEMVEAGSDPAMVALCDQMIAEAMTVDDATALAEANGYIARVGTIDGEPQAVTMDYRVDRFTFDVADGLVIGCTYG